MAITLNEAAKLSTDILQKGVIETMVRNSAVLELLPFMEVVGNAYTYNQIHALPTVAYREVNEGYVESGSTFDLKAERLFMLGGEVYVDKFIAETRGNVNDQRAIQTEMKSKAIAEAFTKSFFHGDNSKNAKEFDGIVKRIDTKQTIAVDGVLTLAKLNELIDAVPFGCDVLLMNRSTRRMLLNMLQDHQAYVETSTDAFGKPVTLYAGIAIRIVEDAMLPNGEIFAIKFGQETDVCGIQNGGVRVTDLGELEVKPVFATRIEWYCSIVVFNPLSVAVLTGITDGVAKAKK